MSPLEKMIIQALENEDDDIILAEVLDFYEYLKEKKKRQKDTLWKNIQEDEPTNEEIEIINNYIQREAKDEPYRLSRNSKERELSYLREKSLRDEISALANAKEKGQRENAGTSTQEAFAMSVKERMAEPSAFVMPMALKINAAI